MDIEILDMDDIKNLKDIYDMYSYIISKCNLSAEDYKVVQETNNNLKKLITNLAESSSRSM
jgi:hypothetical protein